MANNFINSKKVKIFAANIVENAPYIKASKEYFANDIAGKKVGQEYSFVLRDAGKVTDGLEIQSGDNRDIVEKEVKIRLKNKKNVVSVDVLEAVTDIEDFQTEIGSTFAANLGVAIEKDVIESTVLDASNAYVEGSTGGGWAPLSQAIASTKAKRVGGKLVGFMTPLAETNLSVNALNNWSFKSDKLTSDFYGQGAIGTFQQAEFVYASEMPTIIGVDASLVAASISETGGQFSVNLAGAAGVDIPKGTPFTINGVKTCNALGNPITENFSFIVQEDVADSDTSIKVQNLIIDECGARNIYKEGISALAGVSGPITFLLEDGVEYSIAQVRTENCLAFEKVKMQDLKGAESTSTTFGPIQLQVTQVGNVNTMENFTRWDVAYGAKIIDNREASLVYLKV